MFDGILLHFSLWLHEDGVVFSAVVGFAAMVHAVWGSNFWRLWCRVVARVVGSIGCATVMVADDDGCGWVAEVVGDMIVWQRWLLHPEIPISECKPLSTINLNFQNDFIWFKLKWFYLYLNEFKESKYLNGVQNFPFKLFIHFSCENFETKIIVSKKVYSRKIFFSSSFIQKRF
jgi:hypothetical protein